MSASTASPRRRNQPALRSVDLLTEEEARAELALLAKEIQHHDRLYYTCLLYTSDAADE